MSHCSPCVNEPAQYIVTLQEKVMNLRKPCANKPAAEVCEDALYLLALRGSQVGCLSLAWRLMSFAWAKSLGQKGHCTLGAFDLVLF